MKNKIIILLSVAIIIFGINFIYSHTRINDDTYFVNKKDAEFSNNVFFYLQKVANNHTDYDNDKFIVSHSFENKRREVDVVDETKFVFTCERSYTKFKQTNNGLKVIEGTRGTQTIQFQRLDDGYKVMIMFYTIGGYEVVNMPNNDTTYIPKENELVLQAFREMQDDGYNVKINLIH